MADHNRLCERDAVPVNRMAQSTEARDDFEELDAGVHVMKNGGEQEPLECSFLILRLKPYSPQLIENMAGSTGLEPAASAVTGQPLIVSH
jgi:hypothetical protein